MNNKEFTIDLIQQDLKHNQLLSGLNKIGLEGSNQHSLRILEMVSKLMKVPKKANDDWCSIYIDCMEEAVNYEITNRGESLRSLAEVTYVKLKVVTDRKY